MIDDGLRGPGSGSTAASASPAGGGTGGMSGSFDKTQEGKPKKALSLRNGGRKEERRGKRRWTGLNGDGGGWW